VDGYLPIVYEPVHGPAVDEVSVIVFDGLESMCYAHSLPVQYSNARTQRRGINGAPKGPHPFASRLN